MRKVCGLIVLAALGTGVVSGSEESRNMKFRTVSNGSTTSSLQAGDATLNLKLAVQNDIQKSTTVKDSEKKSEDAKAATGKTDQTSKRQPKTLKPQKRKVLVFKATWCGACQSLNYEWPHLKKAGWRVGEKLTDHIQLVDADQRPDLISRYGISSLPTLVLVDDNEELAREGSMGARNIAEFYYGRLK